MALTAQREHGHALGYQPRSCSRLAALLRSPRGRSRSLHSHAGRAWALPGPMVRTKQVRVLPARGGTPNSLRAGKLLCRTRYLL